MRAISFSWTVIRYSAATSGLSAIRLFSLSRCFPFLLPIGRLVRRRHLHRRHLVFGAVGRPVGIFGGDDIGAGHRMVEGGVDHALRHALGDHGAQRRGADAAGERDHVAIPDAAHLGVVRMDLEHVLLVPGTLAVRRVWAPTLYCDRMRPVVRISGKKRLVRSGVGTNSVIMKRPLPRTKPSDVHDRRALRRLVVARPLHAAELVELVEADAGEGRRHARRSRP